MNAMIMKSNIYNTIKMVAMAAVVMACAVSCMPEESKTPVFPELVTRDDVIAGEEIELTFTPNMDWTVSISDEGINTFFIKDGPFETTTLSGKYNGEDVTIIIGTSKEGAFSIRSCDVELTMGGETRSIAHYMMIPKERMIEVRAAMRDENGFVYQDGNYVYSEPLTNKSSIELMWDENIRRFYYPIKVESNFEWEVSWPEWARADITASSRDGILEFDIYGIPSKLPMAQTTGSVVFRSKDETYVSFSVAIPSAEDKFTFNMGGNTSFTFDHACYLHSSNGAYTKDPAHGFIFGSQACRVVLLEFTQSGYVEPAEPWVQLTVDAWDSSEGADILQERAVTVGVSKYTGKSDRSAIVLFLPATAPTEVSDLLEYGLYLKKKYEQYAVYIQQKGRPAEYFTFDATSNERQEVGISFEKAAEPILPSLNFEYVEYATNWQYELSYTKEMASSMSALYITEPYDNIEIYDADGNLITENLSEHWLSFSLYGEGLYGQVVMAPTEGSNEKKEGYIVFKVDGKVLCAVHCIYVPEYKSPVDIFEDASAELFVDPSAAAEMGATIYKVVAGPTYEDHKKHLAPIYVFTQYSDDKTLEINTSTACNMYFCQGKKNGPEMVTIDNQIYSDPEIAARVEKYMEDYAAYVDGVKTGKIDPNIVSEPKYPDVSDERSTGGYLKFGKTCFEERTYPGYSEFRMKMPEKAETTTMQEVILFSTAEGTPLFVFVCNLDLSGSIQ